MDYAQIAGALANARILLIQWNEDHTPREYPFEWVEEMLLAKYRWHSLARQRNGKALDHYTRYIEFQKKLPRKLVDEILKFNAK